LLDQLDEVPLTSVVVERVIEIRSQLAIELPDAIIAASALIENLPLMTRNVQDFKSFLASN
jgi:predicted nucleic acid-binding protein